VEKNAAYPPAVKDLKEEEAMPEGCELRQSKYLNNIIEQDYRGIKRITRPMLGFKSFDAAQATLTGIELMRMLRKDQLDGEDMEGLTVAERFYELAA
jgi:IS6 family transposase